MGLNMILCDTNILIDLFKNKAKTIQDLEKIGFENIVLSSITVMELIQGVGNKNELNKLMKQIQYFDVAHFNYEISQMTVEYISKFRLSHNLQIPDAIIAATSNYYNLKLFTYNLKDFIFIPQINLYNA